MFLPTPQVVVNDVHIRYEDCDIDPVHPFALGLMLESMAVQSTDEFWDAKFVTGGDKARKLFDLQNISVYFDTELLGDIEGQDLVVRTCTCERENNKYRCVNSSFFLL